MKTHRALRAEAGDMRHARENYHVIPPIGRPGGRPVCRHGRRIAVVEDRLGARPRLHLRHRLRHDIDGTGGLAAGERQRGEHQGANQSHASLMPIMSRPGKSRIV